MVAAIAAAMAAACALLLPAQATFAQTWPNLPTTPISVSDISDPNLVVTLDDSGSMAWAYVPDSLVDDALTRRFLASRYNPLAYNPFTAYLAPYNPSTVNNATPTTISTTFGNAWFNGFDSSRGSIDLTDSYCPTVEYDPSSWFQTYATDDGNCGRFSNPAPQRAYFYAYYSDVGPSCGTNCFTLPTPGQTATSFTFNTVVPARCTNPTTPPSAANLVDEDCYVKVSVPNAHQQNFANWYSFYRTRNLTVASGANVSFINLNPKYRVAWQALNTCNGGFFSTCRGWDGVDHPNKLRPFSDTTNKTQFYQWLARLPANNGTALRSAMIRAGEFFRTDPSNNKSPMANDPGFTAAPVSACRPNYHVMLTDGLWNNDTITAYGNFDNTSRSLPDGKSFASGLHPYSDSWSNTLADISMFYWATDLQPTIANSMVPYYIVKTGPVNTVLPADYWSAQNDPATWQHMVNFTIGLGLGKFLTGTTDSDNGNQYMPMWESTTYNGDFPNMAANPLSNSRYNWPQPGSNFNFNGNDGNVADLWHAAVNSRGQFFSADSPRAVQRAFSRVFSRVNSAQTSLGQVGASTNRVSTDSVSLDVKFVPGDGNWYSTLTGYQVYADGTRGPALWTTDSTFTSGSGRQIFTWSGSAGMSFAWGSFSASDQNTYFSPAFNGIGSGVGDQTLFNWLTGDRSKEFADFTGWRVRPQLLGDIVDSDLVITGQNDFGFAFMPDVTIGSSTTSFATARAAYPNFVASKVPVAFVGANDGMLHAFDVRTGTGQGTEKFAYVPYTVWHDSNPLTNLANLASNDYVHQFYVDGPLGLYDTYVTGAWRTYLTGGLGAGGKGVYILDVTGPTQGGNFTAGDVVAELTNNPADANLKEMGYTYAPPIIVRTTHGDWVALISNGYGGASCHAVLFVYNLKTKALTKLDTGNGDCSTNYNGLSAPTPAQFASGAVYAVYAGDYRGNVWKFNVDAATGNWTIGDSTYLNQPFFTASGPSGNQQWITSPITVKKHPAGGNMLLFGTGKFFESNDRADVTVQSFYGIRDAGSRITSGRGALVAQTITAASLTVGTSRQRKTTNNAVDYSTKSGWYLDLNSSLSTSSGTTASGERIVSPALINFDTVIFNSYIPNVNSCSGAGSGYLMDLLAFTGGADPAIPLIDANGDGVVDLSDQGVSGLQLTTGVTKAPSMMFVTGSAKGSPPPVAGGSTTCGGANQAVCPQPVNPTDPPAGCIQGLTNKGGICTTPSCPKGYSWVSTISDGTCVKSVKQPVWMELN